MPTAAGKSATSVEIVIYTRGSPEGDAAPRQDEIGEEVRSSRFVCSIWDPFVFAVNVHAGLGEAAHLATYEMALS